MLGKETLAKAAAYWSAEMGFAGDELFRESLSVRPHGDRLADYNGIFALFRDGKASISHPQDHSKVLRSCLPEALFSPDQFAGSFPGKVVIGPAYIGYAETVPPNPGPLARALDAGHLADAAALREACSGSEWDHGGSEVGEVVASGVFVDRQLAALAGYEVWDGTIAHISVVTHPAHRGKGHGRAAVADLARRAMAAGLLPQYRTLQANAPSLRIAESLGFVHYATSVAVRLGEQP